MAWQLVAMAAISAWSARSASKNADKIAKANSAGKTYTTTRTPYMPHIIQRMAPYIMNEALSNYAKVSSALGGSPMDFSTISKMLQASWEKPGSTISGLTPEEQQEAINRFRSMRENNRSEIQNTSITPDNYFNSGSLNAGGGGNRSISDIDIFDNLNNKYLY